MMTYNKITVRCPACGEPLTFAMRITTAKESNKLVMNLSLRNATKVVEQHFELVQIGSHEQFSGDRSQDR